MSGYLVIHAYPISDQRTDYGVAGGPYSDDRQGQGLSALEAAENQLSYCQGLQQSGRRGTEGRYFIARYEEVFDAALEGPHSRACGIRPHPHGTYCHSNCPTCLGSES